MRKAKPIILFLTVALAVMIGLRTLAQDNSGGNDVTRQPVGDPRFPAPDFPTSVDWINVPAPLTMPQLRGKIVLLDFWTYGCINCIHMIPVLEKLEDKYGDALVIIGVHSAKFENEGKTENIREIVKRYNLHHPVINDHEFAVWGVYRPYGMNAWPTFAVIDPRGNLFAVQAGEIPFDAFDKVIGAMVAYFDEQKEIKRDPLKLALEADKQPPMALAFPGKVRADVTGSRLFITDSNHHRIIIADLKSYEVLDVIGTGERGSKNGSTSEATFNKPQGVALDGNTLYVADTENHVIRAVDLVKRTVTTAAGTGIQGNLRATSGKATETPISSPWDVEMANDGHLYIAMAGTHQIWRLRTKDGVVESWIGSGREGLVDDTFSDAQLAQPSGLYFRDGMLYFADSESSSIRVADLAGERVRTLAGPTENNLFDFGDVDGGLGKSRLQHALGVTGGPDGLLYVADTYNSKIKLLNPETRQITTLFGLTKQAGFRDGGPDVAQVYEPGGLSFAEGKLYVADTNNHAIRVIDLAAKSVNTIVFPNPTALQIGEKVTVVSSNAAEGEQLSLPEQTVQGGKGEIVLNITLPKGYKLNNLAPFTAKWSSSGDAVQIAEADRSQRIVEPALPVRIPVALSAGGATLTGDLTIYYCEDEKQNLCFIDQVKITAPVTVSPAATGAAIKLERTITPPQVNGFSG